MIFLEAGFGDLAEIVNTLGVPGLLLMAVWFFGRYYVQKEDGWEKKYNEQEQRWQLRIEKQESYWEEKLDKKEKQIDEERKLYFAAISSFNDQLSDFGRVMSKVINVANRSDLKQKIDDIQKSYNQNQKE
ncbi:MAG: hypothetical protein NW226_17530 [Microscillaceae bacterium]|nr:hypothetical protein [Microscillaceae bacterium]